MPEKTFDATKPGPSGEARAPREAARAAAGTAGRELAGEREGEPRSNLPLFESMRALGETLKPVEAEAKATKEKTAAANKTVLEEIEAKAKSHAALCGIAGTVLVNGAFFMGMWALAEGEAAIAGIGLGVSLAFGAFAYFVGLAEERQRLTTEAYYDGRLKR
jgi:hypothetical protein